MTDTEAPDPAAVERLMIETFWRFHLPEPEKTDGVTWLRINAALRAGLAAVLPAHRRQVLEEAADSLDLEAANLGRDKRVPREWEEAFNAAAALLRRLASADVQDAP